MGKISDSLTTVAVVLFIGVGFVQMFAVVDYLHATINLGFIDWIIAGLLAWFPPIGSVMGVMGAYQIWGWGLMPSLLLFFWFIPLGILVVVFSLIFAER